jgi:5-methyltetrahydropteroyltriglutamate--homocysteine methyltransferase
MLWAKADGGQIDEMKLQARIDTAVKEVVAKQLECGIDIVSDGEYSKLGFSLYVTERFTGFGGESAFFADDLAEFPALAGRLFSTPGSAHIRLSNCVGPVGMRDAEAVHRDIKRLKQALGDADPSTAFMGTVSPGQIAFNYPNQYYPYLEEYYAALSKLLAIEYRAITDAGLNLQVDSPDLAMSAHCRLMGGVSSDWSKHMPLAISALNEALKGIPARQVRLHVCWGNYAGPHHKDIGLQEILADVLKANAGTIYLEGANPRHEHEWRVFEKTVLPKDKRVILGVIDVKTNYIEHPQVVADRLVRLAKLVGRDRVMAGTDCGFDTFIRTSSVDPDVAWRKLQALAEGAKLASQQLS